MAAATTRGDLRLAGQHADLNTLRCQQMRYRLASARSGAGDQRHLVNDRHCRPQLYPLGALPAGALCSGNIVSARLSRRLHGEDNDMARDETPAALYVAIEAAMPPVEGKGEEGVFVPGEGPLGAPPALVGERPGDREDPETRPFVGPAGTMLDARLAAAGLERGQLFLTNAVKRLRFVQSGKRRLHQPPNAGRSSMADNG